MNKPSIKQPSVRINLAAKQKLDQIQAQTDLSQPALLDRAIELLEREMRAKQLEADFADLAADQASLEQYRTISEVFEGAAQDGLYRNK